MRRLVAIFTLVLLSVEARADDADVRSVIDLGLTFPAKDNLAWKESKKCYECHHAPLIIWAKPVEPSKKESDTDSKNY